MCWQQAGEERRVGGEGERAVAVCIVEGDPLAAQRVKRRGRAIPIAVELEPIGSKRVNRDEEDRCRWIGLDRRGAARLRRHGAQKHQEEPLELHRSRFILSLGWPTCSAYHTPVLVLPGHPCLAARGMEGARACW